MFGKSIGLITRNIGYGIEILILNHPADGIKFPGGTIEDNELPEHACLRECIEETEIHNLVLQTKILDYSTKLRSDEYYISENTPLTSRPDEISFKWAKLPRGVRVVKEDSRENYSKIVFTEFETMESSDITYQLRGWVKNNVLTQKSTRYTYHLTINSDVLIKNKITNDGFTYKLEWVTKTKLKDYLYNKNNWLQRVYKGYEQDIILYLDSIK